MLDKELNEINLLFYGTPRKTQGPFDQKMYFNKTLIALTTTTK